jgi:hypothetical protein
MGLNLITWDAKTTRKNTGERREADKSAKCVRVRKKEAEGYR